MKSQAVTTENPHQYALVGDATCTKQLKAIILCSVFTCLRQGGFCPATKHKGLFPFTLMLRYHSFDITALCELVVVASHDDAEFLV